MGRDEPVGLLFSINLNFLAVVLTIALKCNCRNERFGWLDTDVAAYC